MTQTSSYNNIGKAKIKGVEWNGELQTGLFSHQLTLQYLDPRNEKQIKCLIVEQNNKSNTS
ncbi:hypothetical protein J4727_10510 [Providencia rettgeri]|uniref:Uncharacterized protein n=1 Tax=Providencia rettgeri TaxID=587 RepID=A0A939NAS3_PRORE|nr:hypothetical protein [Providencia rettgeri]